MTELKLKLEATVFVEAESLSDAVAKLEEADMTRLYHVMDEQDDIYGYRLEQAELID